MHSSRKFKVNEPPQQKLSLRYRLKKKINLCIIIVVLIIMICLIVITPLSIFLTSSASNNNDTNPSITSINEISSTTTATNKFMTDNSTTTSDIDNITLLGNDDDDNNDNSTTEENDDDDDTEGEIIRDTTFEDKQDKTTTITTTDDNNNNDNFTTEENGDDDIKGEIIRDTTFEDKQDKTTTTTFEEKQKELKVIQPVIIKICLIKKLTTAMKEYVNKNNDKPFIEYCNKVGICNIYSDQWPESCNNDKDDDKCIILLNINQNWPQTIEMDWVKTCTDDDIGVRENQFNIYGQSPPLKPRQISLPPRKKLSLIGIDITAQQQYVDNNNKTACNTPITVTSIHDVIKNITMSININC